MSRFVLVLLLAAAPVFAAAPNERLDVALRAYRLSATGYREGRVPQDTVATWSQRVWELQKADKLPNAGADYLYRMKELERVAATRVKSGSANELELLNAQYLRLEAERVTGQK